jgi:hypothetical protein
MMNDGEKRLPATKPFPKAGFQITTEKIPPDDLPRYEQKRTDTSDYPSVRQKRKGRAFAALGNDVQTEY